MRNKKNPDNELILKGILLGFLFSIEIFKEHLDREFDSKVNAPKSLIKAGLLMDILNTLSERDEDGVKEIYEWVTENYDLTFDDSHIEYLRYRIELMITKIDLTSPPNPN